MTLTKEKLDTYIDEALNHDDVSSAGRAVAFLKTDEGVPYNSPELFTMLQFVRMPALDPERALDLLRDHLDVGLAMANYNFFQKLYNTIQYIEEEGDRIEFLQSLLETVRHSGSKVADQTIQNWVVDYEKFPSASARKSNIDLINYVTKSERASHLKAPLKIQLLEVLRTYDFIKNRVSDFLSVPALETEPTEADFNIMQQMPGLQEEEESTDYDELLSRFEKDDKGSAVKPPAAMPAITAVSDAVKVSPQVRASQSPVSEPTQPKPAPVKPAEPSLPPPPADMPHLSPDINLQSVLNRGGTDGASRGGIKYDQQSNVKVEEMAQRMEADRKKNQDAIDLKLETLKKRKTDN